MNSKDINDPIINMILAEGKWDVANVKISTDIEKYYTETFEKLDEELTQQIKRLDESVDDSEIFVELFEEFERLANQEDLTEEEHIFADVLETRLDEFVGRLLRGLKDTGKNIVDRSSAFIKRGMGKPGSRIAAARHMAQVGRRNRAGALRTGMAKDPRMEMRLRRESGLSAREFADKAKGMRKAGADTADILATTPRSVQAASMKRAKGRRSGVETKHTTTFKPGQTDAQRRQAYNTRNKGWWQKDQVTGGRKGAERAAQQFQINEPPKAKAKGKKAPPPPTAKGKKAKGDLAHTEYQGEGFTLAEAIIHNVKNRLL